MENELWKAIAGYEGLYEVSNFGRVRSIERYRKSKNGSVAPVKSRYLKPKINRGYYMYSLSKNAKLHFHNAHRLVAEAFIPNPLNLPQINHKDEDKLNNFVENLEWCDASYNTRYSIYKISHPVILNNIFYPSIRECSRKTGIDSKSLRRCLKGCCSKYNVRYAFF